MIETDFSEREFLARGPHSDASQLLAIRLAEQIRLELGEHLKKFAVRCADELNALGHNLAPVRVQPDWVTFRDEPTPTSCRLWFGLNLFVACGYPQLPPSDDLAAEGM